MTRHRSRKGRHLKESNRTGNTPQTNAKSNTTQQPEHPFEKIDVETKVDGIEGLKSLLDDETCRPGTSSSAIVADFNTNTAALYDELDSFRQRWKRELEETKQPEFKSKSECNDRSVVSNNRVEAAAKENSTADLATDDNINSSSKLNRSPQEESADKVYAESKKLFLIAVELERDEMHHESIRYYKQAMHLCPDIEKQIFREQCEASARAAAEENTNGPQKSDSKQLDTSNTDTIAEKVDLYDRICQSFYDESEERGHLRCKSMYKQKPGAIHISELPHELIMQIFHYIVGQELDLSSLESTGMACKSFFIISRDQALWRSICYSTWGSETLNWKGSNESDDKENKETCPAVGINWRQMFLDRPRVNYDGVYISRTRYIRQGDVGFQDITYRPFHVVRYYRYLRFFPDKRVLILTTNEEPDKIVPIFRHALHSKQFSSELSIMEGAFEFTGASQVIITAEKDCRSMLVASGQNQRRQAHLQWSRQTPLAQKFSLKFELKTTESRPYKNNVLKWLEYTILTRLETGQEITTFDLSSDTFPNLYFIRVKKFNLRLTKPLSSH